MLGKLMKHEFKATGRMLLPIYGALLVLALINRLFLTLQLNSTAQRIADTVFTVFAILYVMMIFAVFIATIIILIQRFYKNQLCDEGYLTNTLPVKAWQHITSKTLVSTIWCIVCTIAVVLSVLILLMKLSDVVPMATVIQKFFIEYFETLGANGAGYMIEFILMVLTSIISSILMVYVSLAIGNLFNKHRVAAALLAYLVLNFFTGLLSMVGIVAFDAFSSYYFMSFSTQQSVHMMLSALNLYNIVLGAAYFIGTNYILSRKLNLQ